ncbi:MAG: TauD/TfdA family dioxygenase, partial [Hyphomicrobiaceae bacterium]
MAMSVSVDTSANIPELPPAVTGPSAWRGPAMAASTEWLHHLSDDDVAEIEAAVTPLAEREVDIARITRSDFPLPNLAPKLTAICDEVIDGRGFALLRGLPVERWSVRQSATAYFGIGCYFGNARMQNGKGHILGHVRDLGRDALNDPTARVYQTRERQTFHTDSCDIVALLCLKTAKSGGASALVSSMTIYNEMLRRRPDLLVHLFTGLCTDRRGEVPAGEKPWHEIPVY